MTRAGSAFAILTLIAAWSPSETRAIGDARNLIPEVRIPQDDINDGTAGFNQIFAAGRHIFSNRFTSIDHYGEAPDGPRRSLQTIAGRPNLPFLRFNGLDAQSCLECHLAIGFDAESGPGGPAGPLQFVKEPGISGGGAGPASNAYGFDEFPLSTVGFVRNPPHTFGAGYIQRLAEEMTEDLLALRDGAIAQAVSGGQAVSVSLDSKGINFGNIVALPTGQIDTGQSSIVGVSSDLVVRPFQWKGLASTIRNFVTGAMNFHFSIQPKELLDRGLVPNDNPNGTVPGDIENEILEGEISAVAIFAAMNRPPAESSIGLDQVAVELGRQLFESVGCIDCHTPSLRIADPRVTIIDPRILIPPMRARAARGESVPPTPVRPTLLNAEKSGDDLAPVMQYARFGAARKAVPGSAGLVQSNPPDRLPGFTISLNTATGPPDTIPRLGFDFNTGSIDVPLYSDLRRHRMGDGLTESFTQGTDAPGVVVPGDTYLTRPLWGVGDTAPWMHDGRALTLIEAILMHAGTGSEANDSVAMFEALTKPQRGAVREFLRSLRLPLKPRPPINGSRDWTGYGP